MGTNGVQNGSKNPDDSWLNLNMFRKAAEIGISERQLYHYVQRGCPIDDGPEAIRQWRSDNIAERRGGPEIREPEPSAMEAILYAAAPVFRMIEHQRAVADQLPPNEVQGEHRFIDETIEELVVGLVQAMHVNRQCLGDDEAALQFRREVCRHVLGLGLKD